MRLAGSESKSTNRSNGASKHPATQRRVVSGLRVYVFHQCKGVSQAHDSDAIRQHCKLRTRFARRYIVSDPIEVRSAAIHPSLLRRCLGLARLVRIKVRGRRFHPLLSHAATSTSTKATCTSKKAAAAVLLVELRAAVSRRPRHLQTTKSSLHFKRRRAVRRRSLRASFAAKVAEMPSLHNHTSSKSAIPSAPTWLRTTTVDESYSRGVLDAG